jgi:hypothetical protein
VEKKIQFRRINGVVRAIHPTTGVQFEFHKELHFYIWLMDTWGFCKP